jgi:hypothetical protein
MRIDFQFDTAAFDLRALPFKIPYPVPFKLFGDETKARPCALLSASSIWRPPFGGLASRYRGQASDAALCKPPLYDAVHGISQSVLIHWMV